MTFDQYVKLTETKNKTGQERNNLYVLAHNSLLSLFTHQNIVITWTGIQFVTPQKHCLPGYQWKKKMGKGIKRERNQANTSSFFYVP